MKGKEYLTGLGVTAMLVMTALIGTLVTAEVGVTPHPGYIKEGGGTTTVSISVTADTTDNYTVEVKERPYFTIVGETSITKFIYSGDTLRFEFTIKADNNTEDGTYTFDFIVLKNGTQVDDGTFKVYVGKGGGENPCASVVVVGGVMAVFSLVALRKRE